MDILSQLGDTDAIIGSIKTYAATAGKGVVKTVLELFYVMKESSTPATDKALIGLALAYNVLPASMRPKNGLLNLAGTFVSITFVYSRVSKLVTPEISEKVRQQMESWFGPEVESQPVQETVVQPTMLPGSNDEVQQSL